MFNISPPRRISNKIILLVLLLELASMSLWGVLTYLGSERELLNTISSKLNESALRTAAEIGHFFDPLEAESQAIAKMLTVIPVQYDDQKKLFHLLLKSRPEIEEISFVDDLNQESIRISRTRGLASTDFRNLSNHSLIQSFRNDVIKGMSSGKTGQISFSKFSEPQIEIVYPIPNSSDLIFLKVNLKWLWNAVQDQVIGKSGYVYVLDKNLTLIAHQDPSLVLQGLNLANTKVPDDLFTNAHKLNIYKNIKGQSVTGVSYFDRLNQWWIIVEQPEDEGLAPLNRVIDRFIIAFILAALSTIIIGVFFARRTMRPLEQLEQGMTRFSNGDRSVQIGVSGNSELSSLTNSFNSMAASLDRHINGLLETQSHLENSRRALQNSDNQVRMLLNSTEEAIYGINMMGICIFCNQSALRYLGLPNLESVIGKHADDFIKMQLAETCTDSEVMDRIHNPSVIGDGIHCDNLIIRGANQEDLRIELKSHPIIEDGALVGAVITFTDTNERYQYQEALKHQANYDSLTDLPNRKLLHERLELAIQANPPENRFSLMFIDLDRFKEINDSLGHKSGDDLLKQLGPRLQALLNKEDLLARLGGDEFAILLRSRTTLDEVQAFVKSILDAITRPFDLEGMQIQVAASIGISMSPHHARDGSTLMRFADVAMYYAKSNGLGYAVYDPSLDAHSPRRLALTGELGHAIEANQLTLYYQPKIQLDNQRIIGFEALVRWNHPEHGLLMPDQFIPLAELGDLINPLTLWVVNKALSDRREWSEQGWDFDVAVNVSVRNLQNSEIVQTISQSLDSQAMSAEHLEMEITESSIMTDTVKAEETLQQLSDLGIRIAIDDYGTGYSSLAYLKKLPVDYLKIDKSFILEVTENENDALIVRSTIELAHNLGLKVIAEGIENKDAWDLLSVLGCDYAQGYYISKPMPAENVISWSDIWVNETKIALAR